MKKFLFGGLGIFFFLAFLNIFKWFDGNVSYHARKDHAYSIIAKLIKASQAFYTEFGVMPNSTFDLITHGGCTENKRPSPEIYEWILEKMRIAPQSCVAIEDSLRGLRSAVNANINVLVTPSIYTKNEDFKEANIVVSSLGEYDEPFKVIQGKVHGNKLVNIDLLNKIINY